MFVFSVYGQVSPSVEGVTISTALVEPDPSAMLQLESNTKGFLVPRMTQLEREMISGPAEGLLIFQTNGVIGFYFWDGNSWESMNCFCGINLQEQWRTMLETEFPSNCFEVVNHLPEIYQGFPIEIRKVGNIVQLKGWFLFNGCGNPYEGQGFSNVINTAYPQLTGTQIVKNEIKVNNLVVTQNSTIVDIIGFGTSSFNIALSSSVLEGSYIYFDINYTAQ